MVGDRPNRQKGIQEQALDSSLLDEAIDSVSVTIATKIHRNLKEKQIRSQSSSEVFNRQKLYPELFKSEKDIAKALEEYGVEAPLPLEQQHSGKTSKTSKYAQRHSTAENASNTNNTAGMVTRQQSQTDIWGRIPTKEPKDLECSICGRQVNGLRFAPHLDKCMGIGTTSRAASSIGGSSLGTRSSQF